eukprot:4493414-Alexandrium_andersonii.AAC.1
MCDRCSALFMGACVVLCRVRRPRAVLSTFGRRPKMPKHHLKAPRAVQSQTKPGERVERRRNTVSNKQNLRCARCAPSLVEGPETHRIEGAKRLLPRGDSAAFHGFCGALPLIFMLWGLSMPTRKTLICTYEEIG